MKLVSADGAEVALRPIRYESPSIRSTGQDWDWDANWLVIRGEVISDDGKRWSFEEPCLTTREARELAQWLRAVVAGDVIPSQFDGRSYERLLTFTEPNLALSLEGRTDDRARIRVHLSLEALPSWLDYEERPEMYEYFVVLDVNHSDLARAINDWEKELTAFPER